MRLRYELMVEQIKTIDARIKKTDSEEEIRRLQEEIGWRTTSMERLCKKREEAEGYTYPLLNPPLYQAAR